MLRRLIFLSLAAMLSACAYVSEGSIQNVRVETPGAENAVCYVYVEKLRYRVHPPQTINIHKSKEDMEVDCLAPGNRRLKQTFTAAMTQGQEGNIVTGVIPGMAWDYATAAMFHYPDVIAIDFTGIPITDEPLPAQNKSDIRQPEDYELEEFLPGRPRMNSDRYEKEPELMRRERRTPQSTYNENYISTGQGSDKGHLEPVSPAPQSSVDVNPAGPQTPASGGPIPLYPGQ